MVLILHAQTIREEEFVLIAKTGVPYHGIIRFPEVEVSLPELEPAEFWSTALLGIVAIVWRKAARRDPI